jgi:hypothetical protein
MSYNGIQLHIKLGYNQVSNFWVKNYIFIFPYDQHKNYTFGPSKQHSTYVYCQTCPMAYKFQIKIISKNFFCHNCLLLFLNILLSNTDYLQQVRGCTWQLKKR